MDVVVFPCSVKPPYGTPGYGMEKHGAMPGSDVSVPAWQGRSIAGPKLRMVEFSAFLEQQRDPEQVSVPLGHSDICHLTQSDLGKHAP